MAENQTSKRKPRLHELIAVKTSLRAQATKTVTDLGNTFEKKRHHFTAKVKSFTPLGENAEAKVEEQLDLQTTVLKELRWVREYIVKAIDASHHVNLGNTEAFADIVLEDGTVIAAHVPAATLLELEGTVEEIRKFCDKIPTLDPAQGFRPAPDRGEGVYVAREVEKTRTSKQNKVIVLYPHTEKHPAQTQLVAEDVPIGTIREQEWSSMMTIADKGAILDRIEHLARAVKKARSRANESEVDTGNKIGAALLDYAFSGVTAKA